MKSPRESSDLLALKALKLSTEPARSHDATLNRSQRPHDDEKQTQKRDREADKLICSAGGQIMNDVMGDMCLMDVSIKDGI